MKKLLALLLVLHVLVFAKGQEWQTDFEQAKALAAQEHRDILMVFQGSDWCSVCMKLDKEILRSEVFQAVARQKYVLLKVDFPRRKANKLPADQQEKNNQLAEQYNQNGYFPLVVLLDEKGRVQGKTGYMKMSPEEYIGHLSSLK